MSYKISKELFEAVMKCKINNYGFGTSNIGIRVVTEMFDEILITYNDFFFKCKEWAYNQNKQYYIESGYTKYDSYAKVWFDGGRNKEFKSNTEQQSVFDACQWILDNKDKR